MSAANKIRVYEISKQLNISNKEVMDLLEKHFGLSVKSHASSVDQVLADKLVEIKSAPPPKPKIVGRVVSRAKRPGEEETKTEEKPEAKAEPEEKKPVEKKSEPKPALGSAVKVEVSSPPRPKTMPPRPEGRPRMDNATSPVTRQPQQGQPPRPDRPGGSDVRAPRPEGRPEDRTEGRTDQRPEQRPELRPDQRRGPHKPKSDFTQDGPRKGFSRHGAPPAPGRHNQSRPDLFTPTLEGPTPPRRKRKKSKPKPDINPVEVAQEISGEQSDVPRDPVKIEAPLTVRELADLLGKRETELIRHLFMKGVMVTLNQTLPIEDALNLAQELEVPAEGPDKEVQHDESAIEIRVTEAKGKNLTTRAPVVSIMGHVDHGKTSLLDAIRQTRHNIVDSEAGGITQSIGAYTVEWKDHNIVFLDTPGHEAFTAMRMRGAQSTDIAILVVAADDGVMPQTIEAINHAKAANIPIIVAVNKIDKEDADPDRVLLQLSEHGLNAEKWGGDILTVEVSALKKTGLDELLETINLVSELQELKADSTLPAEGLVVEAQRDKGKGPIATVLVQSGTLRVGDNILIGAVSGRVRALIDDHGNRVDEAGPSMPVEILGLGDVPHAGELFKVYVDDKQYKQEVALAQLEEREQRFAKKAAPGLMAEKESQDFYVIIKADTQGSLEAVSNSLLQMATDEVAVHILHAAPGDISETDVMLATANDALIVAFNSKADPGAHRMITEQKAKVKFYDVIYHITEDAEKMMLGLLAPEQEEKKSGSAEVRQLFSVGKKAIAGCYVTDGKIVRNGIAKVIRGKQEIFTGNLDNLRRFKEDVKEVASGYECGISFDKFNELQEGDIIELYILEEVKRTSLT